MQPRPIDAGRDDKTDLIWKFSPGEFGALE